MLRDGVALQQQKALLNLETFRDLRQGLEHKAVLLLESSRSEPNEEAVRKRLNKQRDHLFTFLDHDLSSKTRTGSAQFLLFFRKCKD
jgi:hypothetical protein